MAEKGALEKPWVRTVLIRELAEGEATQTQLAFRHDVSQSAVYQFAERHAPRIAEVRGKLDEEFAGLWSARKVNRISVLQQQVEDIADMLDTDPAALEGSANARVRAMANRDLSTAELMGRQVAALRAIADELGQIPARVQVQHSGSVSVAINGVDVDQLR